MYSICVFQLSKSTVKHRRKSAILKAQNNLCNKNELLTFFLKVTEGTAECLKAQNIPCTFRDTISVKGKGQTRVYFVDLTDSLYINIEGSKSDASTM